MFGGTLGDDGAAEASAEAGGGAGAGAASAQSGSADSSTVKGWHEVLLNSPNVFRQFTAQGSRSGPARWRATGFFG